MSARSCRDVRADLSAYLDGDLDAGLTGETRAHLENCADCRLELDQLRLAVGALRGLPDLPPPAAILAGVRSRLRPEPWYRPLRVLRWWPLGVPVGALATVLVVIGIALFQARYPDLSKTVPQGPVRKTPEPPAAPARRNVPAEGTLDSATLSHGGARGEKVAAHESAAGAGADNQDRYRGTRADAVGHAAPTDLKSGAGPAEPSPPSPPEPRSAAPGGALREESQPSENLGVVPSQRVIPEPGPAADPTFTAGEKAPRALFDRDRGRGASLESARLAVEKATRIEVVCLLPADGSSVDDVERLLRREGAVEISTGTIGPAGVREAFAPHRLRLGFLPEPARGWTVAARVPSRALAPLLRALASRPNLRLLEQPARPAPEGTTEPLDLRITVLR